MWNPLDDAETYRANAVEARRRGGGSTVRVYATTHAMYAARGGDRRTEGGKIADSVRDLWRRMKDDALWQFQSDADLFADEDLPF